MMVDVKAISSVADVFERLGGASAVARALGVGQSTASEMKRRGRIPVEHWPTLIEAARRLGVRELDADRLMRMHSGRREGGGPVLPSGTGQFTRFLHLRRARFGSIEEINDHVAALRAEWERR